MSSSEDRDLSVRNLSLRARLIGGGAYGLIRLLSLTYRWRLIRDSEGLFRSWPEHPLIWVFWHNRIFALPAGYRKFMSERRGAILSSASRDGEVIAAVMSCTGIASVRGSSSRRGSAALLGLRDWIRAGYDVGVVPDGPRGPRYRLGPGVIKLASITNAKILPIRVEYGSYWEFRSWDRFRLPKPFTTVEVFFDPLVEVPAGLEGEAFEEKRLEVERTLMGSVGA